MPSFKSCPNCNAILSEEIKICPVCNKTSFKSISLEEIGLEKVKPWFKKWPATGRWEPVSRKDSLGVSK